MATILIAFRIPEHEKRAIESEASELNLTVSEYIRSELKRSQSLRQKIVFFANNVTSNVINHKSQRSSRKARCI